MTYGQELYHLVVEQNADYDEAVDYLNNKKEYQQVYYPIKSTYLYICYTLLYYEQNLNEVIKNEYKI